MLSVHVKQVLDLITMHNLIMLLSLPITWFAQNSVYRFDVQDILSDLSKKAFTLPCVGVPLPLQCEVVYLFEEAYSVVFRCST